jgi:hypothetical protein
LGPFNEAAHIPAGIKWLCDSDVRKTAFTRHLPGKPEACFDDAMPAAIVLKGCRAMYRLNGLQREEVLAS